MNADALQLRKTRGKNKQAQVLPLNAWLRTLLATRHAPGDLRRPVAFTTLRAGGSATSAPSGSARARSRAGPPLPRPLPQHRPQRRPGPHPSATSPRARPRQPLPVQERAATTPKVRRLRELPQSGRRGRGRHPRRCRWLNPLRPGPGLEPGRRLPVSGF
jgi:hypothetical protein